MDTFTTLAGVINQPINKVRDALTSHPQDRVEIVIKAIMASEAYHSNQADADTYQSIAQDFLECSSPWGDPGADYLCTMCMANYLDGIPRT